MPKSVAIWRRELMDPRYVDAVADQLRALVNDHILDVAADAQAQAHAIACQRRFPCRPPNVIRASAGY